MAKTNVVKLKSVASAMSNDWQAESDMRTLMDAEAIKRDPKRLAAAKAMAMKRYEEMEEAGLCGKHKDGKSEKNEKSEKDDR